MMVQVAKEHLGMFKPHQLKDVGQLDLGDPEHLLTLLKKRENMQFDTLRNKMGKAVMFTQVRRKKTCMKSLILTG